VGLAADRGRERKGLPVPGTVVLLFEEENLERIRRRKRRKEGTGAGELTT